MEGPILSRVDVGSIREAFGAVHKLDEAFRGRKGLSHISPESNVGETVGLGKYHVIFFIVKTNILIFLLFDFSTNLLVYS